MPVLPDSNLNITVVSRRTALRLSSSHQGQRCHFFSATSYMVGLKVSKPISKLSFWVFFNLVLCAVCSNVFNSNNPFIEIVQIIFFLDLNPIALYKSHFAILLRLYIVTLYIILSKFVELFNKSKQDLIFHFWSQYKLKDFERNPQNTNFM